MPNLEFAIIDRTAEGAVRVVRSFQSVGGAASSAAGQAEKADASLQHVSRTMHTTASAGRGAESSFAQLAATFGRIAGPVAVVTVGLLKLKQELTEGVRAALAFERAMAEVSTVLPANTRDLGALEEAVRRITRTFGGDAVREAKGLYEILSSGVTDTAQAVQVLTAANELAVGGLTDVATAADGLTSILNAWGAQAGTVTQVTDAMFHAMAVGKITIGEISESISHVAPLASATGVSLQEVLSASAALSLGGMPATRTMRYLAQVLSDVVKPSSQASEELARLNAQMPGLNLSFSTATLRAMGLAGFLRKVDEATRGNTDSLARLFGGTESIIPVLALVGNQADAFTQTLHQMETQSGQTAEALAKITRTDAFQLDQAKAEWADFTREVGELIVKNILGPLGRAGKAALEAAREAREEGSSTPPAGGASLVAERRRELAFERAARAQEAAVARQIAQPFAARTQGMVNLGRGLQAGIDFGHYLISDLGMSPAERAAGQDTFGQQYQQEVYQSARQRRARRWMLNMGGALSGPSDLDYQERGAVPPAPPPPDAVAPPTALVSRGLGLAYVNPLYDPRYSMARRSSIAELSLAAVQQTERGRLLSGVERPTPGQIGAGGFGGWAEQARGVDYQRNIEAQRELKQASEDTARQTFLLSKAHSSEVEQQRLVLEYDQKVRRQKLEQHGANQETLTQLAQLEEAEDNLAEARAQELRSTAVANDIRELAGAFRGLSPEIDRAIAAVDAGTQAYEAFVRGDYVSALASGIRTLASVFGGAETESARLLRAAREFRQAMREITQAASQMGEAQYPESFLPARQALMEPIRRVYEMFYESASQGYLESLLEISHGNATVADALRRANALQATMRSVGDLGSEDQQTAWERALDELGINEAWWRTSVEDLFGTGNLRDVAAQLFTVDEALASFQESLSDTAAAAKAATHAVEVRWRAEEIAAQAQFSQQYTQAGGDVFAQRAAYQTFMNTLDVIRQQSQAAQARASQGAAGKPAAGTTTGTTTTVTGTVDTGSLSTVAESIAEVLRLEDQQIHASTLEVSISTLLALPDAQMIDAYVRRSLDSHISTSIRTVLGEEGAALSPVTTTPGRFITLPGEAGFREYFGPLGGTISRGYELARDGILSQIVTQPVPILAAELLVLPTSGLFADLFLGIGPAINAGYVIARPTVDKGIVLSRLERGAGTFLGLPTAAAFRDLLSPMGSTITAGAAIAYPLWTANVTIGALALPPARFLSVPSAAGFEGEFRLLGGTITTAAADAYPTWSSAVMLDRLVLAPGRFLTIPGAAGFESLLRPIGGTITVGAKDAYALWSDNVTIAALTLAPGRFLRLPSAAGFEGEFRPLGAVITTAATDAYPLWSGAIALTPLAVAPGRLLTVPNAAGFSGEFRGLGPVITAGERDARPLWSAALTWDPVGLAPSRFIRTPSAAGFEGEFRSLGTIVVEGERNARPLWSSAVTWDPLGLAPAQFIRVPSASGFEGEFRGLGAVVVSGWQSARPLVVGGLVFDPLGISAAALVRMPSASGFEGDFRGLASQVVSGWDSARPLVASGLTFTPLGISSAALVRAPGAAGFEGDFRSLATQVVGGWDSARPLVAGGLTFTALPIAASALVRGPSAAGFEGDLRGLAPTIGKGWDSARQLVAASLPDLLTPLGIAPNRLVTPPSAAGFEGDLRGIGAQIRSGWDSARQTIGPLALTPITLTPSQILGTTLDLTSWSPVITKARLDIDDLVDVGGTLNLAATIDFSDPGIVGQLEGVVSRGIQAGHITGVLRS